MTKTAYKHHTIFHKRRHTIAVCLFCLLLLSGCRHTGEELSQSKVAVEIQAAAPGEISLTHSFIGTLSAESTVYVIPLVSGEVLEVTVQVGDTVQAGEVLARIDDASAQLQMDSAQASYDSAKAGARAQLGGSWDVQTGQTQAGIDQLYASIAMYEQQLRNARQQLRDLNGNLDDAQNASDQALASYTAAQKKYLTASNLYTLLSPTLSLYQNLATTAGLNAAYNTTANHVRNYVQINPGASFEAIMADAAQLQTILGNAGEAAADIPALIAAVSVSGALQGTGIQVEYLSTGGLATYQQEATLAASTYEKALSAYSTLKSNQPTLENSIIQLEGAIAQATISLQSTQEIAGITEGQIRRETQQAMDAQVDAAGVGIDAAQLQLDMYTLTAPISGVIDSVGVTRHGLASSASPAFTISNTSNMLVATYISEDVRNTLEIGQAVEIERKGELYGGVITELGSSVDPAKGLFLLKVRVDTRGDSFAPGTSVSITARTFHAEDVLTVPYGALYYEGGNAYVYVARDGKAVKTYVQEGLSNGKLVSLQSGLEVGDLIITSWSSSLRDGIEISYDADAAELAARARQAAAERLAANEAAQRALEEDSRAAAQEPPAAAPYVEIAADGVNLRAEASAKSNRLRQLEKGVQATLLEEVEGWYHIALDTGEEGYVSSDYAQLVYPDGDLAGSGA